MWIVWMMIGALIGFSLFAILAANKDYKNRLREAELMQRIDRMEGDSNQERQGYNLMLRIKDEEISRLKEMLNDKSGSNTDR